jgi:hypothetical protein
MKYSKRISQIFFYLILIVLFNSDFILFAQSKSMREQRSGGIFLQIFGPTVLGLNFDYHLSNQFDADFGFGIAGDLQLGVRYQPLGNQIGRTIFPYIGFFGEVINELPFMNYPSEEKRASTTGFYIPIGLEWYAYDGLTLSLEIGYNNTKKDFEQANTKIIYGAFRIGYYISL